MLEDIKKPIGDFIMKNATGIQGRLKKLSYLCQTNEENEFLKILKKS
jgi:hypothetical protein